MLQNVQIPSKTFLDFEAIEGSDKKREWKTPLIYIRGRGKYIRGLPRQPKPAVSSRIQPLADPEEQIALYVDTRV